MQQIKLKVWNKQGNGSWVPSNDGIDLAMLEQGLLENMEYYVWLGIKDKNGTDINEADVYRDPEGIIRKIQYYPGGFYGVSQEGSLQPLLEIYPKIEVLGSYLEKPELFDDTK